MRFIALSFNPLEIGSVGNGLAEFKASDITGFNPLEIGSVGNIIVPTVVIKKELFQSPRNRVGW